MRPVFAIVCLLFAGLPWSAAEASTLYRCKGKGGETAFTSSKTGYSDCTVLRTVEPDPVPAAKTSTTAMGSTSTAPRVEFRSAPGDRQPSAPADPASRATTTRGAVYKYVKDGVTHYTNRRPAGVKAAVLFTYIESCFACSIRSGLDFHSVALNSDAFNAEVANAAALHGVDPAFVRAVIHAESAFNPNALSNKGAQGLMQLMPGTADRFGVSDPFDPAQNIAGGTEYLGWLLKRFGGDTRLAAAAYNSGEGSVDRFGGVPPYDETQVYVERVGILHQRYASALASSGSAGSPSSR